MFGHQRRALVNLELALHISDQNFVVTIAVQVRQGDAVRVRPDGSYWIMPGMQPRLFAVAHISAVLLEFGPWGGGERVQTNVHSNRRRLV